MAVFRRPRALHGGNRLVETIEHGRGRVARFERGGVHERLEGRSRLPLGLDGAIESAVLEVAAAHHRAHVARLRIERDQCRLQRRVVFGGRRVLSLRAACGLPLQRERAAFVVERLQ